MHLSWLTHFKKTFVKRALFYQGHIVRKWKWIAKNRARFDTSKNFIGRVLLLSKTDKWEYLQSLITEIFSFLVLTFGKFLEALGRGMRTCSIFCHSFSLSNNVRCYCAPYLEISSSLATSLEDNSMYTFLGIAGTQIYLPPTKLGFHIKERRKWIVISIVYFSSCSLTSVLIITLPAIFWIKFQKKATKILRNLHLFFTGTTYRQKEMEISQNFCGLLRIYELYSRDSR